MEVHYKVRFINFDVQLFGAKVNQEKSSVVALNSSRLQAVWIGEADAPEPYQHYAQQSDKKQQQSQNDLVAIHEDKISTAAKERKLKVNGKRNYGLWKVGDRKEEGNDKKSEGRKEENLDVEKILCRIQKAIRAKS